MEAPVQSPSPVPPTEESAVAPLFVQQRVALFALVIFIFAGVYLGMAIVFRFAAEQAFFAPGRDSHLFATGVSFVIWQIGRRPKALPPTALAALDVVGSLALCACMVLMGHGYAAHSSWGVMAGTLSIFHVVMARAILVPSTPKRTFLVTALAFGALVASHALIVPDLVGLISSATTGGTGTALATVASRVIYRLHRDVTQARQLGQYTLEEKIGEGGMGEVYRARHAMLRRPTAIKLLGREVSERDVHRFEKEVQLTAELTHPNTISIYDYGRTPDGTFYYAMELLNGVTLQTLVDSYGPQPPARVIHILKQVCAALREAHGAGLIHRDIKPDNVFLCRQGGVADVVKVLDFGLVKQVTSDASTSQSNVQVMVGTPLYMSPEAIAAPERVDEKSDLYALGAVAYFLLSGGPVFNGDSVVEVCGHHLHSQPEPLSSSEHPVPEDLERLVLCCLAKEQGERPASANELGRSLEKCAAAGAWAESDAETWWRSHAGREKKKSRQAPRTLRIALDGRVDESVLGQTG
jgi:serine/threonine-protein kinase